MKKSIRFIVMIVFMLVLSGCNVNINLTINDKYEVKENSYITLDNDIILLNNTSIDSYLNDLLLSYEFTDYKFKKIKGDKESGVNLSNDYIDINNYVESPEYYSLFLKSNIDIKNEILDFSTGEENYESVFDDSPDPLSPNIEVININIKFYNEVVENNADNYDKKNNIYTWTITKNKQPEAIYFKTSKKIRYDVMIKDMIEENISYIIIFGILVTIITISFIFIKEYINKNNEI